jgi:hypothetical protein
MGRFFLLPGRRLLLDLDFLARAIIHLLVAVHCLEATPSNQEQI